MHEAWSHWMHHLLDVLGPALAGMEELSETGKLDPVLDVHFREVLAAVKRWRGQMETPYGELDDSEKDFDREWAQKVLAVLDELGVHGG